MDSKIFDVIFSFQMKQREMEMAERYVSSMELANNSDKLVKIAASLKKEGMCKTTSEALKEAKQLLNSD